MTGANHKKAAGWAALPSSWLLAIIFAMGWRTWALSVPTSATRLPEEPSEFCSEVTDPNDLLINGQHMEILRGRKPVPVGTVRQLAHSYGLIETEVVRLNASDVQPNHLSHQLNILDQSAKAVRLHASGEDPQLEFVDLGLAGCTYLVLIELEVPQQTLLRLYHRRQGDRWYDEARSVCCHLAKGFNRVVLPVVSDLPVASLRLDPLTVSGDFSLHTFAIKPTNEDALAVHLAPQLEPSGPSMLIGTLRWGLAPVILLFAALALIGCYPTMRFRKELGIESLPQCLSFCFVMGSTVTMLALLTVGQLGFTVLGLTPILLMMPLLTISLLLCYVRTRRSDDERTWLKQLWRMDLLEFYDWFCLFALFAGFFWVNQHIFVPNWDHFSYWLTDAKLIFESGKLRTTRDVISLYPYSSLYSLHSALIYWSLDGIREQYAALFTLAYAFCGSAIALSAVPKEQRVLRHVALVVLVITNLSFIHPFNLPFTSYADLYVAVLVGLVIYVATRPSEPYIWRMIWVIPVLIALALAKPSNVVYVAVIGAAITASWLIGSASSRRQGGLPAIRTWLALLTLTFCVFGSRAYYKVRILGPNHPIIEHPRDELDWSRLISVEYYRSDLFDVIVFVASHHFAMMGVALLIGLLLWRSRKMPISVVPFAFLMAVLPAINLAHWALVQRDFGSASLLRYVTTVFYAVPIFLCYANLEKNRGSKVRRWLQVMPVVAVAFGLFLVSWWNPLLPEAHDGSYFSSKWQRPYVVRSQRIQEIVGTGTLVVCMSYEDGQVTNETFEGYCLNYYLSTHVVGGTFRASLQDFEHLVKTLRPDFLYVVNRTNSSEFAAHFGIEAHSEALLEVADDRDVVYRQIPIDLYGADIL